LRPVQADTTYSYVVASTLKNRTSGYSAQASAKTAPAIADYIHGIEVLPQA
jgi:hypothetical protein